MEIIQKCYMYFCVHACVCACVPVCCEHVQTKRESEHQSEGASEKMKEHGERERKGVYVWGVRYTWSYGYHMVTIYVPSRHIQNTHLQNENTHSIYSLRLIIAW